MSSVGASHEGSPPVLRCLGARCSPPWPRSSPLPPFPSCQPLPHQCPQPRPLATPGKQSPPYSIPKSILAVAPRVVAEAAPPPTLAASNSMLPVTPLVILSHTSRARQSSPTSLPGPEFMLRDEEVKKPQGLDDATGRPWLGNTVIGPRKGFFP